MDAACSGSAGLNGHNKRAAVWKKACQDGRNMINYCCQIAYL